MFGALVYSEHCKLAHGGDFVRRVILLHKNETITSPCIGDSLIPFELSGLGECSCPGSTFCSPRISVSVPSPCYRSST